MCGVKDVLDAVPEDENYGIDEEGPQPLHECESVPGTSLPLTEEHHESLSSLVQHSDNETPILLVKTCYTQLIFDHNGIVCAI